MSGWHHHGDNVTMGYVLKGTVTLEFGPGGSQQVEVAEGGYSFRRGAHRVQMITAGQAPDGHVSGRAPYRGPIPRPAA